MVSDFPEQTENFDSLSAIIEQHFEAFLRNAKMLVDVKDDGCLFDYYRIFRSGFLDLMHDRQCDVWTSRRITENLRELVLAGFLDKSYADTGNTPGRTRKEVTINPRIYQSQS